MAEQVALQAGLSAGADRPETLARLAPVVLDTEASSVTVVVEPDELDDFRDQAGRWGFDDVNEWAAAMATKKIADGTNLVGFGHCGT